MSPESLVELKSLKAQHEVGLIYLLRRQSEIQRQVEKAEQQLTAGGVHSDAVTHIRRNVQTVSVEIERKRLVIGEIDRKISQLEDSGISSTASDLTARNEDVTGELATLRASIVGALESLAEPLRRFSALSEEKVMVARHIAQLTGRDNSYATYIESVLLRQSEYNDNVKFAIEYLKRARVAS